jgi:apolipoprotein N-acyltransferase
MTVAARGRQLSAWLLPAVASGLALVLAFPPYDLGWLAWLALLPLFRLILSDRPRPAAAAFSAGVVFFLGLLAWMRPFAVEAWVAAAAICAAFWALFAVAARFAARRGPAFAAPFLLAAAWTTVEWLRGCGPFGFAWGNLAATQHRALPLLQVVSVTGPYGLTYLLALLPAALAAALRPRAAARGPLAITAALVALCLVSGEWMLRSAPRRGASLRTAVIQASSTTPTPGSAVYNDRNVADYERLTRAAVANGARLVIWPETTLPEGAAEFSGVRAALARLLPPGGALIGGAFGTASHGGTTNSALAIGAAGNLSGRYDKVALVPYGEYVPARGLFPWITQYGIPETDLTPGRRWRPLGAAGQQVGAAICFESSFPGPSRQLVREGATLLVILTSDGWVGRESVALQHAALAPLRAVECRRSVARAAATGVSLLIDPYGRAVGSVPLFAQGSAVADLPLRADRSLYVRVGDWPVWLSAALLLWALVGAPGRRWDGSNRYRAAEREAIGTAS